MDKLYSNAQKIISSIQDIRSVIDSTGVDVENTTLFSEYANKIKDVHDSAVAKMYRAWWDNYTINNTRTSYSYTFQNADFSGIGGFNPPYKLTVKSATEMFRQSKVTKITGDMLDLTQCTSVWAAFGWCYSLTEATGIDMSKCTNINYAFAWDSALHTLDIIMPSTFTGSASNTFVGLSNLQNLTIGGTIACTGVTFANSKKLTSASIENLIGALSDDTSGISITLPTVAKTTYYNAHSEEYADEETAWGALINTKPNWTIVLG